MVLTLDKVHKVAKSAGIERDQQGAKLELKLQHTMDGNNLHLWETSASSSLSCCC